jgi:transposase
MNGYQVTDALWARIEPLIPKHVNAHPRGGGRKRIAERTVFNAILFVARTGCQWKALDATGIYSGSTAHLRFQEWTQAGVFQKLWTADLLEYDKKEGINVVRPFTKIAERAGIGRIARPFDNMRASRATEVHREYGAIAEPVWLTLFFIRG